MIVQRFLSWWSWSYKHPPDKRCTRTSRHLMVFEEIVFYSLWFSCHHNTLENLETCELYFSGLITLFIVLYNCKYNAIIIILSIKIIIFKKNNRYVGTYNTIKNSYQCIVDMLITNVTMSHKYTPVFRMV